MLDSFTTAATLATAPVAPWDATLFMHSNATAEHFNARCLDGSNGGFYFRKATSPTAENKWKFHMQGGGWCTSENNCAARALTPLGSSKAWTPTLSTFWGGRAAFSGLMSASVTQTGDEVDNPFGDWNFVWLAYCDGSIQTSDRVDPHALDDGTSLHFRGRALLDAHLHELEAQHAFLSTAEEVIISGTSAGGMSTYMQSSFIKSKLTAPGAKLVAVPDAGFWWDTLAFGSDTYRPWLAMMEQAIVPTLWNATLRGSMAKCLDTPPGGNRAKCFSQPYAYSYLDDVPTFVVQSLVDPAGMGFCFKVPCHLNGNTPGSCTAEQLPLIAAYSAELRGNITAAQAKFGKRDGHFLTSCAQHEETCRQYDWFNITIGQGLTMNSTFTKWYTEGGGVEGSSAIDVGWPGDDSCRSTAHGAC